MFAKRVAARTAKPKVKTQEKNVIFTYNRLNCLFLAFSKKRKKLKFVRKL